jgi:hypothetical protein
MDLDKKSTIQVDKSIFNGLKNLYNPPSFGMFKGMNMSRVGAGQCARLRARWIWR